MATRRLAVLLFMVVFICISYTTGVKYSNIVLIGGTGDLAKKYLWQGFFNLYLEKSSEDRIIKFYGAGRTEKEKGEPALQKILEESVSCQNVDRDDCEEMRKQFQQITEYQQLKTVNHYVDLTMKMEKAMADQKADDEGTLFYLSVPPFTYGGIVSSINSECRPPEGSWFRVVLEKPFGHDTESALKLSEDIAAYLKEEEVYRIDHYLGKLGVEQIIPFRFHNKDTYDELWSKEHIERVEIVMKEDMDVKGRMGFYDEYGVIRDVMQNHLTEILALVAMETPNNISDAKEHQLRKLHLMKQIEALTSENCVVGQYEDYNTQLRTELNKPDFTSHTPTFATVAMQINNPRWKGVPFILMAGKLLDEKTGYVRIVFKQNILCVTKKSDVPNFCHPKQIIFSTSASDSKSPVLLVSKTLPEPKVSEPLKLLEIDSNVEYFGLPASHYFAYSSENNPSAYSNLIKAVYEGQKDKFVGTDDLIASWKIWTPLLQSIMGKKPRLYPGGKANSDWLDVVTLGNTVKYTADRSQFAEMDFNYKSDGIKTIPAEFRNGPLVSGRRDDVIQKLCQSLELLALDFVEMNGVFHMALSGGKTPNLLFKHLVLYAVQFPWQHTHIWQVDERCVDSKSNLLNLNTLKENLLQYVDIPQKNVHSMPVELTKDEYEDGKDLGSAMYEAEIQNIIPHESLDFILLGVGADGHTASLFPGQPGIEDEDLVKLVDRGPADQSAERLSMSLNLINKAKNVAVLVTGESKKQIVSLLKQVGRDSNKWPITGVNLADGLLAWYVDHDALL